MPNPLGAAEYAVTFAAASGGISGPRCALAQHPQARRGRGGAPQRRRLTDPRLAPEPCRHGHALLAAGNPIDHRGFVPTVLERQPFRG